MFETDLLIAGQARPASNGGACERRDPVAGAVATCADPRGTTALAGPRHHPI